MNFNWKKWLPIILIIFYFPLEAQILGFVDDFENCSLDTTWKGELKTLWGDDWYPGIFTLSEQGGFLKIAYDRKSSDGEWPAFYFTPPELISVDHLSLIHI